MASKNLDITSLTNKFAAIKVKLQRYLPIIFIVLVLGMYSFLVFRINSLVASEPSEDAIAEKLQNVQRPKIDQSAIDKINQLQDNSSEVQALFKAARENPFQE